MKRKTLFISIVCLCLCMAFGVAAQRRRKGTPPPLPSNPKPSPPRPRPLEDRLKDVENVSAQFIQPIEGFTADLVEFVKRDLKLAIRAGYDIDLLVRGHWLVAQAPRIFKVRNGVSSVESATEEPGEGAYIERRRGLLTVRTPEEAYELGLCFFLTDAHVESGQLRYTILSNPECHEQAFQYSAITNLRTNITTKVLGSWRIESRSEPQTRATGLGGADDQYAGSLTIVTLSPVGVPFIHSNDIDVAAVWKSRKQ